MGFDINRSHGFNRPNGSGQRSQDDQRLTECKICPDGIFMTEPRIWASRIEPSKTSGLVHVKCAEEIGATTIGQPTTGGQRKYRT